MLVFGHVIPKGNSPPNKIHETTNEKICSFNPEKTSPKKRRWMRFFSETASISEPKWVFPKIGEPQNGWLYNGKPY